MVARSIEEHRYNFAAEVSALLAPSALVNRDSGIGIWGGQFTAAQLADFLTAWSFTDMPYRIWEYAHRIEMVEDQLPRHAECDLLQRARVFGKCGDLSLRRDGANFHWHFIGACSPLLPAAYAPQDFWQAHPDAQLRRSEDATLLWGEGRAQADGSVASWQEDRVGWAQLNYPGISAPRVQLTYTLFTEDGQPAFVWWRELKAYE